MTRRWMATWAAVAVLGMRVGTLERGRIRVAETNDARNPSPSKTVGPDAGKNGGTKHGTSAKHAPDRTHRAGGDESRPAGGPYHDPPTGSARESGPGSGAGL